MHVGTTRAHPVGGGSRRRSLHPGTAELGCRDESECDAQDHVRVVPRHGPQAKEREDDGNDEKEKAAQIPPIHVISRSVQLWFPPARSSCPATAYHARAVVHHSGLVSPRLVRASCGRRRAGVQSGCGIAVAMSWRSSEIPSMVDTSAPEFTTWRRLALIFGVWALVAVMAVQTTAFAFARTGRSFDWVPVFASQLESCMLWATFTPFLLALGRRFRIERGSWPAHLALHLAVGVAFTVLDVYSWVLEAP